MLPKNGPPPQGIDPGTWDYLHEPDIASRYDAGLEGDRIAEADRRVLQELLRLWPQGSKRIAIDFGCGTGRAALQLADSGFQVVAVDLSEPMLRELAKKLSPEKSKVVSLVQANLMELGCLASEAFELGLCLYSTLGMLRGRNQRKAFLREAHRVLKPDAVFVVHAHHVWWQLNFPGGLRYLMSSGAQSLLGRGVEFGDRFADQVSIRDLPIHSFRLGELKAELNAVGFAVETANPIVDWAESRNLICRILGIRTQGWLLVCRRRP